MWWVNLYIYHNMTIKKLFSNKKNKKGGIKNEYINY